MFSDKAKKHADACRFCWMCRHVCPVGQQTGKEVNTARAKGLLVSLNTRGTEFDGSFARAMYECCLCAACANDCVTGYNPPLFIREARTKAVVEGLVPPEVQAVIGRLLDTGNLYGLPGESRPDFLKEALKGLPGKADTVLYLGGIAPYKAPAMISAVASLLKKAGVSFAVLQDEAPSGAYLGDLIGFVEEVRVQAAACAGQLDGAGAKTVIVLDPIDARMMRQQYSEWNCAPRAEIVTATSYIAGLIREGKLKPSIAPASEAVTCHDPSALARDLDETQPVREIIAAMGLDLKEMFLHKRLTRSSGGALMNEYAPEIVKLTARARIEDARRLGIHTMITASPNSFSVLSEYAPSDVRVQDIFGLLDGRCQK